MREKENIRDIFTRYLSLFSLDNESTINECINNYAKIYGARKIIRKNSYKNNLAIAFSICNTLAKEHTPRPPHYIAQLCNVPTKAMLNIVSALSITPEEKSTLKKEDYELQETCPEEYIDVICAHLGIPFHIASEGRETVNKSQRILFGRYPTVIAAASLEFVLRQKSCGSLQRICELLGCKEKTVEQAIDKLNTSWKNETLHIRPVSKETERRRRSFSNGWSKNVADSSSHVGKSFGYWRWQQKRRQHSSNATTNANDEHANDAHDANEYDGSRTAKMEQERSTITRSTKENETKRSSCERRKNEKTRSSQEILEYIASIFAKCNKKRQMDSTHRRSHRRLGKNRF
jgi:hypothetical protein